MSVLTWQHGGFGDVHPEMDACVEEMKVNPKLAKEFRAAYAEMVKIIEEGRIRFKQGAKGEVSMRLEKARKQTVSVFSRSQLEVKSKFRGVLKSVYEKRHPGRIQAKQMKVVRAKADGKMVDLVLVPTLPQGEYGVNAVDLQGVDMTEVQDDGEAIISEQQLQRIIDNFTQGILGGAHESLQNGELEEQ